VNTEFIAALHQLEREKGIAVDVLIEAIEAALIAAYRRNFGTVQNVRVEIDRATGQIHVLAGRTVVEAVIDPRAEIGVDEAGRIVPGARPGDVIEGEVTPNEFGRIAAQTAKQVVVQRVREAERGIIFEEFSSREGDVLTGIVHRVEHRTVLIDLGKTEAVLPPSEQIPGEEYRQGERLKTYIVEVKKTTKGPQILVSRTHPGLLKRLFELEVPEIHDGTVEIKAVAREAGARSKIGVASREPNVDAVGSCVGPKGMRVQTVVAELKGEKVDIVRWDADAAQFVANALSPARVVRVDVNEEGKVARVVVPDYQLSLAIGKEGQNARLAAKLTGWKIDIRSESQAKAAAEAEKAAVLAAEAGVAGGEAAAPAAPAAPAGAATPAGTAKGTAPAAPVAEPATRGVQAAASAARPAARPAKGGATGDKTRGKAAPARPGTRKPRTKAASEPGPEVPPPPQSPRAARRAQRKAEAAAAQAAAGSPADEGAGKGAGKGGGGGGAA